MNPEQIHIDKIRSAFEKMQSREDLLQLLNEAKPLVYGEKAVPFDLKQLTWFANPKLGGKRYVEFKIKKKSRTPRTIHAPVRGLKALQKTLSFVLQCVFEPHKAAMGFVREKSIVDNARMHEGSHYVYNIDLKDFFPSVDQARVWKCLQLKPFNLIDSGKTSIAENPILQTGIRKFITENGEHIFFKIKDNKLSLVIDKKGNFKRYKERLTRHLVKPLVKALSLDLEDMKKLQEYNELVNNLIFEDAKKFISSPESIKQISNLVSSRQSIANTIASLCCTEMEVERKYDANEWALVKRSVLPQGAPTSPVITNIICQRLDYLLSAVAKRFGLKYSRYADDITFSSMHNVYQPESDFLKELQRIILEQGFYIKESKTRLQKDGYRQEVTGLLVNEKVNVQQRYIKQLRMWLYYWERYGYERAYGFFLQQYMADKGKPDMVNVIGGKLDYLKMVKGPENELYLKLKGKFAKCLGKTIDIKVDIEVFKNENNQKLLAAMKSALKKQIEAQEAVGNANLKEAKISREIKKLEQTKSIEIHDPRKLAGLLSKFSLDSSPIKYSTHPIEKMEQFANFYNFISNFKEDELIEIRKYKSDLWDYLIYPFLFQSNDEVRFDKDKNVINTFHWGEHELKLGWKYNDLLKRMFEKQQANSNRKTYPLSTKIDKQYQPELRIEGKFLNTWNDYIEIFKNEIEFRYHNLEKTVKSITAPLNTNFDNNIQIEGLSGLNFYTYTSKIKQALRLLIYPYNEYATASNPKLEIQGNYDNEQRTIELRIVNIDSYWDAILDENIDKVSLKSSKGQLGHVRKLLYGLCDWALETRLRIDNNYTFCRINYLGPKYKVSPIEKNIKKPLGHTHILTFYI